MKKDILIIIDAQNDFITGALGSVEADNTVPKIVDLIKSKEWDYIFLTADTHNINAYSLTSEGKHLPVMHCEYNTPGWNIDSRIINAINETKIKYEILEKSKFGDITLPYRIAGFIDSEEYNAVLCGFCTDICVVSNALILKATTENEIYLKEKCCAGTTIENHNAAVDVMMACHINMI